MCLQWPNSSKSLCSQVQKTKPYSCTQVQESRLTSPYAAISRKDLKQTRLLALIASHQGQEDTCSLHEEQPSLLPPPVQAEISMYQAQKQELTTHY